jgi:hypothetical protein
MMNYKYVLMGSLLISAELSIACEGPDIEGQIVDVQALHTTDVTVSKKNGSLCEQITFFKEGPDWNTEQKNTMQDIGVAQRALFIYRLALKDGHADAQVLVNEETSLMQNFMAKFSSLMNNAETWGIMHYVIDSAPEIIHKNPTIAPGLPTLKFEFAAAGISEHMIENGLRTITDTSVRKKLGEQRDAINQKKMQLTKQIVQASEHSGSHNESAPTNKK